MCAHTCARPETGGSFGSLKTVLHSFVGRLACHLGARIRTPVLTIIHQGLLTAESSLQPPGVHTCLLHPCLSPFFIHFCRSPPISLTSPLSLSPSLCPLLSSSSDSLSLTVPLSLSSLGLSLSLSPLLLCLPLPPQFRSSLCLPPSLRVLLASQEFQVLMESGVYLAP